MSPSKVFRICVAYEQGVGQGADYPEGIKNPYPENTDEHEAWEYGFEEGKEKVNGRESENLSG